MIRTLLLAALLLTAAAASAQPAEQVSDTVYVAVAGYWNAGETRFLDVTKRRFDYQNGALAASDSTVTAYTLVVESADDTSYTIRWTPTAVSSTKDYAEQMAGMEEAVLEQLAADGFHYRTTEYGEFVSLEDTDLLVSIVQQSLDETFAEQQASAPDGVKDFLAAIKSPEFILSAIGEPIELYHRYYGYEYMVGIPWEYEEIFPNRIGPDPIQGFGRSIVEQLDTLAGTMVLRNHVEADPESLFDAVLNVLMRASGKDREAVLAELGGMKLTMAQEEKYLIDSFSGWVREISWQRVTESGEARRVDSYSLRLRDE